MMTTKKPIGMLIMILALVLVAVILVVVIVASSGGDDDTTPATTTTTPTTSTVITSTDPTDTTTTPVVTTTAETPISTTGTPVTAAPPVLDTPDNSGESGTVSVPSANASTGLLIDVSATNPYKYDLENVFKGDHETTQEVIAKSDFKRLVSASDLFVTPGWTHYVRKDTYNALVAMITTFGAQSGTVKALQISGYTATMSESVTDPFITGNVISMLGYSGGTLGLNYGLNKVTVNGESMTFDKWFEKFAVNYGFFYEGLTGSDNLKKGTLRYVGTTHAAGVKAAGSLSASLAGIKDGTITSTTAADGSTWNLSYVAASAEENTTITVGANATYTVSGDNMGGFIVAVLAK